ncbi:hypothetical protein HON22_04345 [Candidatus Peregrinibacteria bacterium]|nr:hypothetical protein [Candidatus Peregrinibacteria bacterium]
MTTTIKTHSALYTQDELIPATKAAKNFGSVLTSLSENKKDKIGILRKSKLEAVVVSSEKYENLSKLMNMIREYLWYKEIKNRLQSSKEEYINFEDILKENNIKI